MMWYNPNLNKFELTKEPSGYIATDVFVNAREMEEQIISHED